MASTVHGDVIRVLLTVNQVRPTASPFREVSGLVRYGPENGLEVTVCALRNSEWDAGSRQIQELGGEAILGRFRPVAATQREVGRWLKWNRDMLGRGFHIQHSMDYSSSPVEVFASRLAGRPIVVTVRDLGQSANLRARRLRLGGGSAVVPITETARDAAIMHGASSRRTTVIPNGMLLDGWDYRDPSPSAESPVLLSVGQLVAEKRHRDAIDVLAKVRREFPTAQLMIVGIDYGDGHGDMLLAHAHRLGVAGSVHLLGGRDDVPDLMRSAQVLIHCAESEAFGWVVVEACAVGLPVVATRSGGPEEIVVDGQTGMLAPVGDTDALAKCISDILRSPQWAVEIARSARRRIELEYGADAMTAKYSELYRAVLRARRKERVQ